MGLGGFIACIALGLSAPLTGFVFALFRRVETLEKTNTEQQTQIDDLKRKIEEMERKLEEG